jgi:hypothetical protein
MMNLLTDYKYGSVDEALVTDYVTWISMLVGILFMTVFQTRYIDIVIFVLRIHQIKLHHDVTLFSMFIKYLRR